MSTRPEHFADAPGIAGLGGWFRLFGRYPTPWIIGSALLAAVAARLSLGGWRTADLVVAAAFLAAQPFTEWVIHVTILHFRPRTTARGRRIDMYIARKHRAHHADPLHIGLIFVALPALVGLIVIDAGAILGAFRDVRLALTAMTVGYTNLLVYEWTHYLIHTPYAPQSRLYRYIWRNHRLHHFKNEHYWFGITTNLADHVLRTAPDRGSVETSPTARNLHGDAALAG